jgi:hypothetical protein
MAATDELVFGLETADQVQQHLARYNAQRLRPALPRSDWREALERELSVRALELAFIESERQHAIPLARQAPREAKGFVNWFAALEQTGPGQHDPLFPYLAERATREEMSWFLTQEIAGEAGFDDLVALTQVKMPVLAKLELARNYWDEMGRGQRRAMHGVLLDRVAEVLGLVARPEKTVWESLALANLLTGLAANRCYAYHAVGALGAVELTAPGRVALVNQGLKRIGVDAHGRQYFALHATLDVKHSEAWNREVLATLVSEQPELAQPIAEGAIMRLQAGARCFARYRRELGLTLRDRIGLSRLDEPAVAS